MSFQYVPSLFRIPDTGTNYKPSGIWKGLNYDSGYFSFYTEWGWGSYVIVRQENLCFSIDVDGDKLSPQYSELNGHMWWQGSGFLYWSIKYGGWVYTEDYNLKPGYEPRETLFASENEWPGDDFYFVSSLPSPGSEGSMWGRGSNYNSGSEKSIKLFWPRWSSKNRRELGEFVGADGETGSKFMGLPRFRSNKWEYFERSFEKKGGYYSYGRIHYEGGKWVIGTIGSDSGWYEGSEPSLTSSVTFKFCKNEGSEIEDEDDLTISYYDHVVGDQTSAAYLGNVAIWR